MEREKIIYQKIPPPKSDEEILANLRSETGRAETEAGMASMLERLDLGHIVKKKPGQMRARRDSILERAMRMVR